MYQGPVRGLRKSGLVKLIPMVHATVVKLVMSQLFKLLLQAQYQLTARG
jgi:hypothetical protein